MHRIGTRLTRRLSIATALIALTEAGELRPRDNSVICLGSPPCFADDCVEGPPALAAEVSA